MPQMAVGFDDPRVTVHYMDGAVFMNEHQVNEKQRHLRRKLHDNTLYYLGLL